MKNRMTVKHLIAFLKHMDQDAFVVVPGPDHSYRSLSHLNTTKVALFGADFFEPGGLENETLVDAVVVE